MSQDRERIRALNDDLRKTFSGGGAVMTPDIAALGALAVARLVERVAAFDAFDDDNDPYGEHDFGALDFDGQRVFFKLDYYDKSLSAYSPDPTDPAVTERVITLMLASEY